MSGQLSTTRSHRSEKLRRLGTSTAVFDLHLSKDQLEFNYAFRQRGELRINLAGKVFYLKVGCKGGKVPPELAQFVKKLDSRWAVKGVTSAGYSSDVAVVEEYARRLPAHLAPKQIRCLGSYSASSSCRSLIAQAQIHHFSGVQGFHLCHS